VGASDEHLAREGLHPGSIAPPDLTWKAPIRRACLVPLRLLAQAVSG
jgi:hypothetical protein